MIEFLFGVMLLVGIVLGVTLFFYILRKYDKENRK